MTVRDSNARSDSALQGHTPLPWRVMKPDEVDAFVPIIGVLLDEDGRPLDTPTNGLVGGATLLPTEIDAEDYGRAKANAVFIVHAANSHYELLAALEAIARGDGIGGPDAELQCADIARAAIAKSLPHTPRGVSA